MGKKLGDVIPFHKLKIFQNKLTLKVLAKKFIIKL